MYRFGKRVPLLLLVGLVTAGLVSNRVNAQGRKSNWCVDPIFSSPSTSVVGSSYTSSHSIGAPCHSCGTPGYAAGMQGRAYGASGYAGMTGSAINCPPPTNAFLRVWVDDRATVWVNGQRTKPQRLAGANRGSRIFSLTGLAPDETQEAIVQVLMQDGQSKTETKLVLAGGSYEMRFHKMVNFEGILPQDKFELAPATAPAPSGGLKNDPESTPDPAPAPDPFVDDPVRT